MAKLPHTRNVMPNNPDPELNSVKNKLAKAYIHALAAKLNYVFQESNGDLDGMGIDFQIFNRRVGTSRTVGSESDQINLQLKGVSVTRTAMFRETDTYIEYNLTRALEPVGSNFYLVVVQLLEENELENWITHNADSLTLKKCAYYIKVQSTLNTGFVRIPKTNILSPETFPTLFIPAINKEGQI